MASVVVTTPPVTVELGDVDEVTYELIFNLSYGEIYTRARNRKMSDPIGASGVTDLMALRRVDSASPT